MEDARPEQYQPPLTWRSHAWRTALVLSISAVIWPTTAKQQWLHTPPLFWLDLGVGLLALVLTFFRRRWPLTIALITGALGVVSITSAGPSTLAAVSLATRRVVWQVLVVGVVGIVASFVFSLIEPAADHNPWWVDVSFGVVFTAAMLVWGMYLGSRRELLWTLRERADRAETDQEARVSQARANERARIAREMHDVLAHRISLVTMHAGALAYRTDLSPEQVRESAELISAKSHEALADLRQVLGVLRSDDPDGASTAHEPPQPTYGDLSELVREAELSGMRVQYDDQVVDPTMMPEPIGRATYRIVQEGLTNARKHAPGTTVLVDLSGSAEEGVRIRVRNPTRIGHNGTTPGAGLGLIGLKERASLAGGRLDGGRRDGVFELDGWLPWAT